MSEVLRLLSGLLAMFVAVGLLWTEPSEPRLVRARPCRCVWVALEDAHELVKVNIDRRKVVARISVPDAPHNLTISPSGEVVAATLWSAGRVVLRQSGRTRVVRLGGSPHDVKIGGRRIVVADQTEARLRVLGFGGRVRRTIGLRNDPHDLALRWGGRQAWVSLEGSDDLAVVRLRSGRVRYVNTGVAPHDLLFAPDGKLWVTDWNGAVHVFSRKGRRLKTIAIGTEAHHLDFTPDGRQVWITDHAEQRIFVIATRTYRLRKTFQLRGAPHHIAITSDGDRAVAADHDRGRLVVYNVHRLRRAISIPVGAGPHGVWAQP